MLAHLCQGIASVFAFIVLHFWYVNIAEVLLTLDLIPHAGSIHDQRQAVEQ